MKRIFLIRHAKSDWHVLNLPDFERPLNERGKRDAPIIFTHFKNKEFKIDLIISSPAKRAITTAEYLMDALSIPKEKIIRKYEIYNAHFHELLEIIKNVDERYENIVLVGHNPGLTMLNNFLSNTAVDYLPTCSISGIELNINNWKEVREGVGKTLVYLFTKMLKEEI